MQTIASKSEVKEDLKSLPLPELQAKLGSSPDGLSQAEAQRQLAQYGYNEIPEKKTNPFLKFLNYFWGPIPWMIEAAVILSAVARHWPDFAIILLLLLANAVVGFWEEHQAGNAIAALKAKLAIHARVRRDGKWTTVAARELVPGDVMRFLPEAPNSVMDYLFIELMLWGKREGYQWFNLGMAPLSGLENDVLAPTWNHLGTFIFRHGEHFYNFQGVREYKEKFDPKWEARYLASPGGLALPRILINIASLISGGLKGVVAK